MADKPTTPEQVTRLDPFVEHLGRLVGARVIGLAISGEPGDYETTYGLRLSNGLLAWIQCDPEGNGPGFLSIERDANPPPAMAPSDRKPRRKRGGP